MIFVGLVLTVLWSEQAVAAADLARPSQNRLLVARPSATAHARRRPGTYAVYKVFVNPAAAYLVLAAGPREHTARTLAGPSAIVLRWGNAGFGYRHIKRRHGYTATTEMLITETVFHPQRISHEPSAIVYSRVYVGDPRLGSDMCTFKVVENPTVLADHLEKGIITAYDTCDTFLP